MGCTPQLCETARSARPRLSTWLAAWAAAALLLDSQAARRAGQAGALEAGHRRLPALAFSARSFLPFLSVLRKKHPAVSGEGEPRLCSKAARSGSAGPAGGSQKAEEEQQVL